MDECVSECFWNYCADITDPNSQQECYIGCGDICTGAVKYSCSYEAGGECVSDSDCEVYEKCENNECVYKYDDKIYAKGIDIAGGVGVSCSGVKCYTTGGCKKQSGCGVTYDKNKNTGFAPEADNGGGIRYSFSEVDINKIYVYPKSYLTNFEVYC